MKFKDMQDDDMIEYRNKVGDFFYPFLANVELGNVSAAQNTGNLIAAFINFNEIGYFNRPTTVGNITFWRTNSSARR